MKEAKENCIFCKILTGQLESSVVYEDEVCIAFMDIQPVNPGHILVIPKKHIPYLDGVDADTGGHLFKVGMQINKALRKVSDIKCEGVNYFLADGEAAMQEVFHTHLHVFPRFKNDGFGLTFGKHYTNLPARAELDKIAEAVRKVIPSTIGDPL